jgi:hypothetical protein
MKNFWKVALTVAVIGIAKLAKGQKKMENVKISNKKECLF